MKNYFLIAPLNIFCVSTFLIIASLYLSPMHAQINASSGGAFDFYKWERTWSWTIDDNDNESPGYFRWWRDGGDNFSELIMELTENGQNTILELPTSITNSILSLSANSTRSSSSSEEALPFIFLDTGHARSSIFYGKDHMLNFSINPKTVDSQSTFAYSEGFRFLNSNGVAIINRPESYGTELMRITVDGNVGIGTTGPTEKLDINGAMRLRNMELSNIQSDNQEGIIYYDRNFYASGEGGGEFFENNGGGLVLNNGDDGWSAIIDTKNMGHLNAKFKSIKIPSGANAQYYAIIGNHIGGGFGDFGMKTNRGNINLESNGTVRIKSLEANTISIGDDNDVITINGEIRANQYAFTADDVRLGNGAGEGVSNQENRRHVFIGHDAGTNDAFEEISLIDYEDSENNDPVTGSEYIQNHSVFVLNNHGDLNKPLMFGKFAHQGSEASMAQLAINTHHVVDSVALTVSGAVHIGPKNIDPTLFPSKEGYEDALLWVERGIVTEDVTFAYTSNWDDWPDYVFEESYNLIPLLELDKYIRKEGHLPDVLSREDVKNMGVNAKNMMMVLLKKIEELTLYTIEQEKKIDEQHKWNAELLNRLNSLEKAILNMNPN